MLGNSAKEDSVVSILVRILTSSAFLKISNIRYQTCWLWFLERKKNDIKWNYLFSAGKVRSRFKGPKRHRKSLVIWQMKRLYILLKSTLINGGHCALIIVYNHSYNKEANDILNLRGSTRCVKINLLDCDIVVCEFELQSCNYVHFRTDTLEKRMKPLILSDMR